MWRCWRVKNCYLVNAVICPCIWINCSMCKQCLVVHFVFKESHHLCILFPIWIGRFFPFLRWGGSVCMCMQVPRSVGICASLKMLGHYSFVFHQLEEFSKVAFVIILEYWCPIVLALHCQWSQHKWHVWLLLMYILLWALGPLGPITLLVQHTYTCIALYLYCTLMPPI